MKCNACWREIEGKGIATTCGHIFCVEDATKILSSESSSCHLCDQMLSKTQMKAVDLNPSDEWINMALAGIPPQLIMKSAFKGIVFWNGQKDVELELTRKKALQLKQKHEQMQSKFMEKLEQVHAAYQKAAKRAQALEQEVENLSKDKTELQEKYSEKARQKRKLEEMYDNLRSEFDQLKKSAVQASRIKEHFPLQKPPHNVFSEPSGFEDMTARPSPGRSSSLLGIAPVTPDFWPSTRPSRTDDLFEVSAICKPATQRPRGLPDNLLTSSRMPEKLGTKKQTRPFETNAGGRSPNPATNALRNLLLSPMKRPASRLGTGFTT